LLGALRKGACLTRVLRVAAWKIDSWMGFWRISWAIREETNMLVIVRPDWSLTGICVGDRDIIACYDAYLTHYSMLALPYWFKVYSGSLRHQRSGPNKSETPISQQSNVSASKSRWKLKHRTSSVEIRVLSKNGEITTTCSSMQDDHVDSKARMSAFKWRA
jgi:hypothetical protein